LQTHAATTGNALSLIVESFDCGMTSATVFDNESRRRESVSATQVSLADMYGGAVPCWQRKMSTARRYAILSGTCNQWRSQSNGVTLSYFRAE